AVRDIDISNDSFKQIEAIIQSMTVEERRNPALLSGSRRTRIAKGGGSTVQDVNKLLKQFEDMRKMMKMMTNRDQANRMMRQMPGMRR
ncbi:MAG: signal recognition particle protein, partial [Bacteroidota bacterium]